jgi:hypothetical protein
MPRLKVPRLQLLRIRSEREVRQAYLYPSVTQQTPGKANVRPMCGQLVLRY